MFAINIIFFAAVIFVVQKIVRCLERKFQKDSDMLWGHTERRYYDIWVYINWKADNLEFRFTELETDIRNMERDVSRMESDEQRINTLHNYARRIHCGLNMKYQIFIPSNMMCYARRVERRKLLSQKEHGGYASNRWRILGTQSDVAGSYRWSNIIRRNIEQKI